MDSYAGWAKCNLYLHQVESERRGQSAGGKVQEGGGWPIKPAEDGFVPVSKGCPWHKTCSLWKRDLHQCHCKKFCLCKESEASHIMFLGPDMSEAAVYLIFPAIKAKPDQEVSPEASDLEFLQRLRDIRGAIFREAGQLLLDIGDANSARKEQGQGHIFSDIQESPEDHIVHHFDPSNWNELPEEVGEHCGEAWGAYNCTLPEKFGEASRNRHHSISKLLLEWDLISRENPRAVPRRRGPPRGSVTGIVPSYVLEVDSYVVEYVHSQALEDVGSPVYKYGRGTPTSSCLYIGNFVPFIRYPVFSWMLPEYAVDIEEV